MERRDLAPGIFTISGVLTADECRQQIAFAEERGCEERMDVDDLDLASRIWSRVQEFVPRTLAGWPVRGLNERFRYYRYAPGQRFSWHSDRAVTGANGEVGLVAFTIYLNEGYEGGEMRFESLSLAGQRGMGLLFEHQILHEDAKVMDGAKYVLRSDVMYGPRARQTRLEIVSSLTRRWRYYEDFYRGRNEGMVAFVARITPVAIADNVDPRNCHAWLCLTKFRVRSVCLLCNKHGSRFAIRWYKGGRPVMYQIVKHIDSARWQRIVAWLELQDRIEV